MAAARNVLQILAVRWVIVCALVTAGCSGTITFGNDSPAVAGDGGGRDVTVGFPDALPPDLGVPDAGMPDMGPGGDAGDGGSTDACTPTLPAAWPHARDKATYLTLFWNMADATPATIKCSATTCHGTGVQGPTIVPLATDLDDSTKLNNSIDQLWGSIIPEDIGGGVIKSRLLYSHFPATMGGLESPPAFTPEEMTFYTALVEMSKRCP